MITVGELINIEKTVNKALDTMPVSKTTKVSTVDFFCSLSISLEEILKTDKKAIVTIEKAMTPFLKEGVGPELGVSPKFDDLIGKRVEMMEKELDFKFDQKLPSKDFPCDLQPIVKRIIHSWIKWE